MAKLVPDCCLEGENAMTKRRVIKMVVRSLMAANATLLLAAVGSALLLWLNLPGIAVAAPAVQEAGTTADNSALGAALAIGLAAIGSGIAVGIAGAAAIGAIAEKPDLLGRTLIIVGLAEGIAIYGLIISFMILVR
jgi:V/A-type H+-transporting ATPase subunit K